MEQSPARFSGIRQINFILQEGKSFFMTIEQRKEEFTKVVLGNIPALNRFAYTLCRNLSESEDLVSETVVKAFEKFDSLKDERKTKPWLFKILRNQFITNFRKNKKLISFTTMPGVSGNGDESFSLFEAIGQTDFVQEGNAEKNFIAKITRQQIQSAINELPDDFRTALILCDIEDFAYTEISQILKIPVGTVRSRIARARNILQKKLWQQARELGISNTVKTKPKDDHICTCGKEEELIHDTDISK
jgi:RNA polymerase sigma-70 factor, ECF subfamily